MYKNELALVTAERACTVKKNSNTMYTNKALLFHQSILDMCPEYTGSTNSSLISTVQNQVFEDKFYKFSIL